jgi:hypothetical protein
MMITRLEGEVLSAAAEIVRCLSKEFPAKRWTLS